MSRLLRLAVMILTLAASSLGQAATLRFAPLPMENQETVMKQFLPMTAFLGKELGVNLEYVYTDNYADVIERFSAGGIDLAYLGPLPYVELHRKYQDCEPLVFFREANGKPKYTCAIVAFSANPLALDGLHSHRFALPQPLSTCGYLAVNGLLRQHGSGLLHNRHRYLDKHDLVALAVVRGEFDGGGIKTAIAKKYAHLGLTVIEETLPMPAFALVANTRTISAERRQAIRRLLTALDPNGNDKKMMAGWGDNICYGAEPASDREYDSVRQYKRDTIIPEHDND